MHNNLIENRQIRVFISSTFRDMQDERDYLMKRTFPKLRKLADERDVTLTELDLRWGITEEEAKNGKVVEICLREIENSIPFFVGIIGNRYGWIPAKEDIGSNITDHYAQVRDYLDRHISVTEMEMQFGVLSRPEDMHAYFYIKEQEEDGVENLEMLKRLKDEVQKSKYPSTTYHDVEDLGKQVELAFTELLDKLFPEGNLTELEKERIGQRSFMHQLCQNYIRDDHNFQVINDWMQDWSKHQLVITGASGLGKSALIANWVNKKLQDKGRDYNIIFHFTGNGGSESNSDFIRKTLSDEIRDIYGWKKDETIGNEEKLDELFIKVASEGKKPLLIVLDAINQIVDIDNAKLLNWLPIPPRNIKILFSTLKDDRTMEVFQNRNYPIFTLQPLDEERRTQLVNGYLHLYSKKLTEQQVNRIITDTQCENTLVLKTLLDELVNFGIYEQLDNRIDYYLSKDTIDDFYQTLLQSYEEEYGQEFVKHILSLVTVSRNGLSEDEILDILNASCDTDKPRVTPLLWSQFYCSFGRHLNLNNGLIKFSHVFISNAVNQRYITADKEWEQTSREEICNKFQNTNTSRSWDELPYQYYALEDDTRLHSLLMNLDVFLYYINKDLYGLTNYWNYLLSKEKYSPEEYIRCVEEYKGDKFDACRNLSFFFLRNVIDIKFSMKVAKLSYEYTNDVVQKVKSYNVLGEGYLSLGNYDKALESHLQILPLCKNVLGRLHPDTAHTYNNMGNVYLNQRKYGMALEYFLEASDIWEKTLGAKHVQTARSYYNIGLVYRSQGDFAKALEYYLKSLQIHENMLGKGHPDTAKIYDSIGLIYLQGQGNYNKALEYLQKALSIKEVVFGGEHPDTAMTYNNIGLVYQNKGDFTKALEYHLKDCQIFEKVLGKEHPTTATSYYNIGAVYQNQGNYDKALEYHHKALVIREKVLGSGHPDTANSYNDVGLVYYNRQNYDTSREYFLKASQIWENVWGTEHPNTILSFQNIGFSYYCQGNYEMAQKYFLKTLWNKEKVLGKKHPETAVCYNQIAWTYHLMKKYEEALPLAEKAVEAVPNDPNNIDTMATVYQGLGRYDDAMQQFELCLKLKQEQGADKDSIKETEDKINLLKKLM